MKRRTHDVIIVGGGAAGLSAASGCAQLGMKTALIEPYHTGGDCLYYGCVPSKSLLRSAAVAAGLNHAPDFGILPSAETANGTGHAPRRGPVPFHPVASRIAGIIDSIAPHDSPERFRGLGVEVFEQAAQFSDAHSLLLADGKRISAPRIILATGSRPRPLPIAGIEETGYITNIDLFSLAALPASIAILGGGPIGVEMGQALSRLGVTVSILEAAPRILGREDPDMAAIIRRRLLREGVAIREGVTAVEASRRQHGKVLLLSDGSEIQADEILMAAGRIGNTEHLNVEALGIRITNGFFAVDHKLRTSIRHILAIGDCNGKYLFTHVASAEASVAVRRLALRLPVSMDYRAVPWVTYTEPELASVGYNEQRAREAGLNYRVATVGMDRNDRARTESEIDGKIKILYDSRRRILGVQIAGPHAGETVMPAVMAVAGRWKLGRLLGPIYPYPTVSEMYRTAAGAALAPSLFNARNRAILRLLFRYRGTGPAAGPVAGPTAGTTDQPATGSLTTRSGADGA